LFIGNGGVLNLQTTDGVIWIQDALPCLLGDINLDRIVNIMDFLLFRNAYGTTSNDPDYEELADISPSEDAFSGLWAGIYDTKNPDGLINIMDFNVFRNNYGLMNPGVPNLVKIAGDDGLVSRNSNTFEWRWLGNTYESEFEYQKDEGPWMAISENQLTWAGYSDGDHVFRVRTLDSDVISWHFHYVSEAFFIEGFEGNDLTYDWDLFGSVHPFVQGEVVSAGNNALRFGDCSDGEVSGATLYLTVDEPMLISFYRKVSSEFDRQVFNMEPVEMPKGQEVPFQKGDHLKFYVDDVLCGYWSGDVDWGRVVRRIPAGTSSLKWVYEKDGYQEELLDTAWIDEILMVPESAHADHLIDLGALVPVSDGMYALLEKVIGAHSMPSLMNVAYENCVKDISELWVIDWADPLKHDKLHIQDIQGIEYLANLKYLYLAYNDFVDGSDLAGLSDLAYVNAKGNGISDLEPFENLLNLRYLQLDLNDISDISPLNGLYQLEALYLANNSIRDIRATRFLSELSVLDLRRNLIGDIRYLENLLHLNELYLQDNHIYNIQSLVNNLGLGAGDVLRLDYNYLDQNIPSLDMDHIQALKNRGVLIEYVPSIVESGVFWMGDTLNYGYYRDEQPIHDVRLTNDFYMGKYEVTNAEFLDFLNDYENPVDSDGYLNGHMVLNANHYFSRFEYTGSRFRLKDDTFLTHPVVYVTWWGAMEYCNWLSRQHGFQPAYDPLGRFLAYHGDFAADISEVEGYRLATEAEWEYAARGAENDVNTVTDYIYAGSNNLTEVGWYQVQTTHQVGQKIPNEIKLYDMSGNVWEWCHDFYGYNYYVESELENPWGPLEGSQRVRRGGSYYIAETCRIHARSKNSPSFSGDDLGFRIVRTKRR